MNIPATLVWASGLESRSARIHLSAPAGKSWRVATQLYPTGDPLVFTAPNLSYLIDSPIEFGDTRLRTFTIPAREGGPERPHDDYQLRRIINSMRRDVFVPAS